MACLRLQSVPTAPRSGMPGSYHMAIPRRRQQVIPFSRIYLGVHTPQDILVGSAAGLLVMWLTVKLIPWIEANPKTDIPVMCIAIVTAIAVALFAAFKSYPVDYDDAGKILVDGNILA